MILACSFRENSATGSGGAVYTTGAGINVPNVAGTFVCGNAPDHTSGTYFNEGGNQFECSCLLPCPSDIDGDCSVGIADFLDLLGQWGTNPGVPPDLDGDGTVGIVDFLMLLANWGPC